MYSSRGFGELGATKRQHKPQIDTNPADVSSESSDEPEEKKEDEAKIKK